MSRPPSGSPSPRTTARTAADEPPATTAGTRTDPGPRVRGLRRVLPLWGRMEALHRSLHYPALSSSLAAFALAGSGVLILHLVQRQTGTTGLLVGLGLALLPLPFVLGSLAWLNQTARVPLRHTLFCLAWGACAATTVALLANGWASDFLVAHQGSTRGETLGAEVATPLIEEFCKGAALLLLLVPLRRRPNCRQDLNCALLARDEAGGAPSPDGPPAPVPRPRGSRTPGLPRIRPHLRPLPYFRPPVLPPAGGRAHPRARSSPRTLAAGLVLGAITACGFAFTENALYLGRAFTDDQQSRLDSIGFGEPPTLRDFDSTVHTFVLRALLSPFAHPLFTALTGLGIAVTLTTGRRWLARLAAPVGLVAAIGLHGVWNAAAELGTDGFLLIYGLVMVPAFAALVCLSVWARARRSRQPARPPLTG
ncbi:PrsW family glutamic-type intramembrane protease [Kitasatospora sp. NPDC051914]|uniref:PrsW family intramembrane metalloprotease n=1 Tax=Kitasatospora sp. NPDC051914 TaxID=3154945 RepID=UPI003429DB54